MHRVFVKAVIRRQVHAATKPGHGRPALGLGRDHAHVHVHRRHIGVARVEHQGYAHGLKGRTRQLRAVLGGRGWQLRPCHMRKAAASAFKNRPAFQNLGDAIALEFFARVFLPGIGQERGAVEVGQGPGDAGLQAHQIVFDVTEFKRGAHGGFGR